MNVLDAAKIQRLHSLFERGEGVRMAARTVGVNRGTAARYRRQWVEAELQRAYNLLWDGDCDACDAVTARLPESSVREMLDAWLDDQCGQEPKSKWY